MATTYFYEDNFIVDRVQKGLVDACGNNQIMDNHAGNANKYSLRIVTGTDNQAFIDICGKHTASIPNNNKHNVGTKGSAIRVRVDTRDKDQQFLASYITPSLYLDDISAIAGDYSATAGNFGKKLAIAPFLPMFFRTICGDGLDAADNRSIRITLKDDDGVAPTKIKNGMLLDVFAKYDTEGKDVSGRAVDISFSKVTSNGGQIRINGGPLGADQAIPEFEVTMSKNATTPTSGDIKVLTEKSLFYLAGAGINLKTVTFRTKEDGDGGEEYFTDLDVAADDASGLKVKNADGLYEYDLVTIKNATGRSFRVMGTAVQDAFGVYGYAMQNSKGSLKISLANVPAKIDGATVTVDADVCNNTTLLGKDGTKAKVSFATPRTADGSGSLTKYEARWASKAQIVAAGIDKNVGFKALESAFPNQVNIQTDICATTKTLFPHVVLTGLSPVVLNDDATMDNNGRYAVFVRAYTTDAAGGFVAGADEKDISLTLMANLALPTKVTNITGKAHVSFGFFTSGVPDAPTPIAVRTGKDALRTDTQTTTDAGKDISMSGGLVVSQNDYNINHRGSHYDLVRYAIIPAEDVQWGDSLADISFSNATRGRGTHASTFDGNDATAEFLQITPTDQVSHEYNKVTNQWDVRRTGLKDICNGVAYAISTAFDNSNGMGFRTPFQVFTTSTWPDASQGLYSLNPTTNTHFTSGFGNWTSRKDTTLNALATAANPLTLATNAALKSDNKKISFGFSLLDKSGNDARDAGLPYDFAENTSGAAPVTSIRYYVNKSGPLLETGTTMESQAVRDLRLFETVGVDPQFGDVCGGGTDTAGTAMITTKAEHAQSVSVNKNTASMTVDKGFDINGALVPLKNGQRYDISLQLVNKNGYNDNSFAAVHGYAPMGVIQAPKNLRLDTTVNGVEMSGKYNVTFDLSFEDLSGVAEHGGHLINGYQFIATQYQGSVSGDVVIHKELIEPASGGAAAANTYQKTAAGQTRGHIVTSAFQVAKTSTTEGNYVLPGYPIKLQLAATSRVSSTAGSTIQYHNYIYNQGVEKQGLSAEITIPGPKLTTANADDDVRALSVKPEDGKLKVEFYKPQTEAVADLYQGSPSVNAYYIYQYDMSIQTLGTATERALSRTVKVVNDAADLASDYYTTELDAINGKAYVVAVHTQWKYGADNNTLALTRGVYHTNLLSATGINDPSFNSTTGLYQLPRDARTGGVGANLTLAQCAVPRGAPSITADNTKLVFDDNGSQITAGSMIQIAPQSGQPAGQPANTTAFHLDLCGSSTNTTTAGSTKVTPIYVGDHATNRNTHDICATTILGANWASEKNFVVIQNIAGSAYVKRNIE